MILFHPNTSIIELKTNVDFIEKYELVDSVNDYFNKLILIPGTEIYERSDTEEWSFKHPIINSVFCNGVKYIEKLDEIINSSKLHLSKHSDLITELAEKLIVNASYKRLILYKLKELIGYDSYNIKLSTTSKFILCPRLTFEKKNKVMICKNYSTGFIYELDSIFINVINELNQKNIFEFMNEIEETFIEDTDGTQRLIGIVMNLLFKQVLLIQY